MMSLRLQELGKGSTWLVSFFRWFYKVVERLYGASYDFVGCFLVLQASMKFLCGFVGLHGGG